MGPMKATQLILNPRFADNANTWSPASYKANGDPTLSVRDVNASEDEANLRLYASSGAETMWREPMVVASDEWEWLQSGNIDYFDYSLMPDPRVGGGIPPSIHAAAVRRSMWGLAA